MMVFSICPGRKSRTKNCIFLKRGSFGVAYVETVELPSPKNGGGGGLLHGTYPYCPYMGVPPTPPSPGLGFCNFRLENKFRTNFNPILTKCWVKFVKTGNAISVFTIF